jgi:hypothetical protein
VIEQLAELLSERLALLPCAPRLPAGRILRRDPARGLDRPGRVSANRHCKLIRARDGWVALNLARPDDAEMVPALTGSVGDPWTMAERFSPQLSGAEFVARCAELQLPAARLGEASPAPLARARGRGPRRVIDLSTLWAGPLCAAILAWAGARVVRIGSRNRPDPTPQTSPLLDRFVNGGKEPLALDLTARADKERLLDAVRGADVLVTSGRAAALKRLGLDPVELARRQPDLIWVAITAHGWDSDRVGFGDDCAVAGGLVRCDGGEPRFLGDALADPLTGVEAALAACERVAQQRGGLVDVSLAGIAAAYAQRLAS